MEVALIVGLGVCSAAIFAWLQQLHRSRPLSWRLARHVLAWRKKAVRVSMASLLRVAKDDRIILLRMTLRREAFGPPGGVIKYYNGAKPRLDRLQFAPERPSDEPHSFVASDLRGRLPGKNLLRFRRWFAKGTE